MHNQDNHEENQSAVLIKDLPVNDEQQTEITGGPSVGGNTYRGTTTVADGILTR
jgi:hypothetical protein